MKSNVAVLATGAILLTGGVLALTLGQGERPIAQAAPEADDELVELEGDPDAGEGLYVLHCATCHGDEGRGDGPVGEGLVPPPSDLTQAQLETHEIYLVTRDGGAAHDLSPVMPAFDGLLNAQELQDVTAYVLELAE